MVSSNSQLKRCWVCPTRRKVECSQWVVHLFLQTSLARNRSRRSNDDDGGASVQETKHAPFVMAAIDLPPAPTVQEEVGENDAATEDSGPPGVPFENLFTLPWALHMHPLPHTSFLIRPDDSGSSSEEEAGPRDKRSNGAGGGGGDSDGGVSDAFSDASSEGSNYRAGTHRLERVENTAPPHSLQTISMLLEHTRCLDAVPTWTRLFELLNAADADPHFANLRAFFDARFNHAGRLVRQRGDSSSAAAAGNGKDDGETAATGAKNGSALPKRSASHRYHSLNRRGRRPSAGQRPPRRSSSQPFQTSSPPKVGTTGEDRSSMLTANPATLLFRKRVASSGKRLDDGDEGEGASSMGEDSSVASAPKALLRAPEITLVSRTTGETRTTRFKIRLDLHAVGLAPPPPKPPVARRPPMQQQQSTIASRLASSPTRSNHDGADGLGRVFSNTSSSDPSFSDGLSLRPVASPDSFRSRAMSDGSDGGNDLSPPLPISGKRYQKGSRTWTMSSTAAASQASELGTSPERASGAESTAADKSGATGPRRGTLAKIGSFSKAQEQRRPSMIQRLMDFKSFRNKSTTSNASSQNVVSEEGDAQGANDQHEEFHIAPSDVVEEKTGAGASGFSASGSQMRRLHSRTHTEHSDYSNDEALDTADDEASVSSSHFASSHRRPSSSGMLMGYKPASDLGPVHEGAVYSAGSSDEGDQASNLHSKNQDEELKTHPLRDGGDFLSLLRSAANVSLTLLHSSNIPSAVVSPARTPKGSANPAGGYMPSPSFNEHRPDSLDAGARERAEMLLAPYRSGGSAAWWLSGSADPLPISISSALSQALGWNGVMDLCYGPGSKSVTEGIFNPLGKAAALDNRQRVEKLRVQNWAQGITEEEGAASSSTEAGQGQPLTTASSAGTLHNDLAVYDKLASLDVSQPKESLEGLSDAVAPSESASVKGHAVDESSKQTEGPVAALGKLFGLKRPSHSTHGAAPHVVEEESVRRGSLFSDQLAAVASAAEAVPGDVPAEPAQNDGRTWQDWADLMQSIADWVQEYETSRVRSGLAGEIGESVAAVPTDESTSLAFRPDSGFLDTSTDFSKTRYMSRMSYKVPYCVVKDAVNRQHGFRRRDGIPEGLPLGPNGEEIGDYRWSNKHLSRNHFASSLTIAGMSLSNSMSQIARASWPHASAWELDYLEMCVFKSPVVARRFPPPGESIVSSSQHYVVPEGDETAALRAMPCPYPDAQGAWRSASWLRWLTEIQGGKIVVPAVSWQAWWTLIAVLNGADGTGRALDVQLKAEEEPFEALTDPDAVFL